MSKRRSSNVNRSLDEELTSAVRKSNTANTEVLLAQGADPTMAYEKYPTLFYASIPNLRLLLSQGIDVDLQEEEYGYTLLNALCAGHSPRSDASPLNHSEKIRLLLRYGADTNLADKRGETPLHSLCRRSMDPYIIRLLLQHHANVNQQDNEGNTVFHHIASNYRATSYPVLPYQEAIEVLLEAGADPLVRNEDGETAAEKARNANLVQLARELEAAEHWANSENNNQATNGGRRARKSSAARKSSKKSRASRNKRTHKRRRA